MLRERDWLSGAYMQEHTIRSWVQILAGPGISLRVQISLFLGIAINSAVTRLCTI